MSVLGVTAGIVANVTEGPWAILGAVVGCLILLITGCDVFLRPIWHRYRLKNGFFCSFSIPSTQLRTLDYVIQDDDAHQTKELIIPSNSEVEIEILFWCPAKTILSEFYFGCLQDKGTPDELERKPRAVAYTNRFMERGAVEETPETNRNRYTDQHKYYHVRREWPLVKNEVYSIGFKLKTIKSGDYRADIHFTTDEVKAVVDDLIIRVEDHPVSKMKCILRAHRWNACLISPKVKTL